MDKRLPIALLAATRTLNVLYSLIPDCDEVFNYYEPLNLLLRGFGKQTWEYAPEYAIRSWCYLLPYAILAYPVAVLVDSVAAIPQYVSFYFVRVLIASLNVYAEYHLYTTLTKSSHAIANWFLVFTCSSTGMSHASVALLPSSLAMTCTTLATSNFLRYATSTHSTRNALIVTSWFCFGGLLGWPFALALAVPSMIYIMWDSYGRELHLERYLKWSVGIAAFYLVSIMEVDYWFYGRTVAVPINIVLYNVIDAGEDSGPNIFGTEDVKYYIMNLLLNFNVVAVLAYVGILVIPVLTILRIDKKLSGAMSFGVAAPIALWSAVFFSQPHKEERFLYPIYTLISASAAVTLTVLLTLSKSIVRLITRSASIARSVHIFTVLVIGVCIITISVLHTVSLSTNYNTPLEVYAHIPSNAIGNVCVGREWYRFPSSMFLPASTRLQFVESGFRGLLPGDFDESSGSLTNSIQMTPKGMNNKNQYDSGKVGSLESCSYMIDIDEPVDVEAGEVAFVSDGVVKEGWELVYTGKFINNEESEGLGRLVYIPEIFHDMTKTNLVYHNYNLYARAEAA